MKITIDLENGSPVQEFSVDVSTLAPVGVSETEVAKVETEVAAVDAELKTDEGQSA